MLSGQAGVTHELPKLLWPLGFCCFYPCSTCSPSPAVGKVENQRALSPEGSPAVSHKPGPSAARPHAGRGRLLGAEEVTAWLPSLPLSKRWAWGQDSSPRCRPGPGVLAPSPCGPSCPHPQLRALWGWGWGMVGDGEGFGMGNGWEWGMVGGEEWLRLCSQLCAGMCSSNPLPQSTAPLPPLPPPRRGSRAQDWLTSKQWAQSGLIPAAAQECGAGTNTEWFQSPPGWGGHHPYTASALCYSECVDGHTDMEEVGQGGPSRHRRHPKHLPPTIVKPTTSLAASH